MNSQVSTSGVDLQNASHANVLYGEPEAAADALRAALHEQWHLPVSGNPDVSVHVHDTLYVDGARALQDAAYRVPVGSARVLVAAFAFVSTEAQNALLKVLEEPPQHTYLFLVTRDSAQLLPTVRSRLTDLGTHDAGTDAAPARAFLAATPPQRIAQCGDIITSKDKVRAQQLLDALEEEIHRTHRDRLGEHAWQQGIHAVYTAREYLDDRAPSVKMLLEYVALTVPVVQNEKRKA